MGLNMTITSQLEAMHDFQRADINGIPVERVGEAFRAKLPNGTMSGWWKSGTISTVIDSWTRVTVIANGYDYRNQAWVVDGRYVACSHPASMKCDCYGTMHAGELLAANADVH